jgi:hypothetical protein
MKKLYKLLALSSLFLGGFNANAQVSYTESFTSGLGGWTGGWSTTTSQACDGNSVRKNIFGSGTQGSFESGLLGTATAVSHTIMFDYKVVDWSAATDATPNTFGVIDVEQSIDGTTWTNIGTIDASNHVVANTCATIFMNFTPVAGDLYVRLNCTYGAGDYYVYFDNIDLNVTPSCPQPTGLTVSNITSSGADINWTSGGASNWNIEYGPAGYTPGSGTVMTNVTNPFTLSSLSSNEDYDVYVQDSCGQGDVSNWSMTNFTTLPNAHPFPLTEDFEDSTLFFENESSTGTPWVLTSDLAHAGSMSVFNGYGSSEDNVLLETGILDLSATGSPVLEFWHIAKTEGGWDDAFVEISTDGGVSYSAIPSSNYRGNGDYIGYFSEDSYSDWGTATADIPTNSWWKKETFDLRDYNVADVRVRFVLSSDGSISRAGWYIDDIQIYEPTCPNPYGLMSSYSSMDSVVLNWNAGLNETMWNIEYGTVGYTQGTGTMAMSTDTTDTIAGLDLGAVYEFYVQADCGGGDSSAWVGPIVVATDLLNDSSCDAIAITPSFTSQTFSNIGATLQANESSRLEGFRTHQNTVWFKTVIPASGHLLIATCGSDFTTRIGAYAYDTIICDSLETYGEIAYSSGNFGVCGTSSTAAVEICGATPGDSVIFYVGGSSSTQEGIINLTVSDYTTDGFAGEGPATPVSACAGDTVDLWSQLTGQLTNLGDWEYPSNSAAIVDDTTANTGAFSLTGNEVYYIVANDCDADTAVVTIDAATQTNTGMAISNFQACSNGDVFLFDGLTGTIDAGGVWSDDTNTGLLNINKFVANGLPNGAYQFTYTVDNNICEAASTQITVNLVNCTGVNEGEAATFGVYPNPNDGSFFISNGNTESNIAMQVLDVQGKVIFSNTYSMNAGAQQEISLGNVESGVYIVRIITNNQVFNSNVIVK